MWLLPFWQQVVETSLKQRVKMPNFDTFYKYKGNTWSSYDTSFLWLWWLWELWAITVLIYIYTKLIRMRCYTSLECVHEYMRTASAYNNQAAIFLFINNHFTMTGLASYISARQHRSTGQLRRTKLCAWYNLPPSCMCWLVAGCSHLAYIYMMYDMHMMSDECLILAILHPADIARCSSLLLSLHWK